MGDLEGVTFEGEGRTVLILEDDVIAQMTLRSYLEELGIKEVTTVQRADDAVAEVKKGDFDLCFMDIRVEGEMDGIEATKKINELSDVPVIYITASSDKKSFDRATRTDHFGFLVKPYDHDELKDMLLRAFKSRHEFEKVKHNEAEQMLDLIYDSADIGMCVTDVDRKFVKVNKAYCRTYGYSEHELLGHSFTKVLPEDNREYAGNLHDQFIAGETDESAGEWKVKCKDGTVRDIYVTAARMKTGSGKSYKVTTVTDITERKRYTEKLESIIEEKEQFVREIHHRVKNNLNIVSGLIHLQADKVKGNREVYKLFLESMTRIKSLSTIHEKLYKRDNLAYIGLNDYVQQLARNILTTFTDGDNRIELDLDIDDIEIDIDKAISCGLIINEVLSNAVKYAFPDEASGRIRLVIKKKGDKIQMKISDNGIGLPEDFDLKTSNTLGMQLIHNLSRKLKSDVVMRGENGTSISITFPI